MLEIISYILAIGAVILVAEPLVRKSTGKVRTAKQDTTKLHDLLNRRTLITETRNDLEFDFQTGKLDKEDYELLIKEQDESLKVLKNKIQAQSGVSDEKLVQQLEVEILNERKRIEPNLSTGCAKCGQEFNPGDKFCSNCGAKLF